MSAGGYDFAAARKRLQRDAGGEESGLPGFPSREEARAADRALIQVRRALRVAAVALYAAAYGTEPVEEEEFRTPEPFPDAPYDFFNANGCLPAEWDADAITFLVVDPYDLEQLTFLVRRTWKTGAKFRFVRRTFLERLSSKLQSLEEENEVMELEDENTLRSMAGEARIVRLVNDIFTRAIELGASDIHIEPGEENVAVRCGWTVF